MNTEEFQTLWDYKEYKQFFHGIEFDFSAVLISIQSQETNTFTIGFLKGRSVQTSISGIGRLKEAYEVLGQFVGESEEIK